jgi:hypothetical protein
MTISTTIIKNSYSGDGSQDTFAYSFQISTTADMEVIIRSSTGTETIKTLTTDYTVTGAGSATGGNVVFESGDIPTATETVILRRSTALTQTLDLVENDPFTADSVESAFDKNLALLQEQQEELDRSFKVSKSNTIASSEFTDSATTRASKTLGFDSSGNLTTIADFLPAGGDSAMFQFATETADADPTAGKFRLNHATIASATIMYADDLEYNGTDVSAWVQSWDDVAGNDTNRGRIRISKANTLDTWHTFKVTGAITDASGYSKITLVYIDGSGTLAADDKVWIAFSASGEDGSIAGYYYKFATSTTDSDPSAGYLRFNNGTYASATAIYIDDVDANGATTQPDTATWGASDSVIKGYIHIVDINDSTTYVRFKVGAAVTDASGYNKITVAHLASNNTFSADDELSVSFVRNGDVGDTGAQGIQGATGLTGDVSLAGTQTLTNKTLTSPKINENVAVTSTATELNLLDGVSGLVQADLTKLAAVDATAAEINYSDLAALGTTAASKVFTANANNLTIVSGAMLNTEDTLTDASTIVWNVINSPVAKVTLGASRTLALPTGTGIAAGQFISLLIIQDGTGSRTITWNAAYEFTADTAPTLTATANLGDVFTFRYNGAKWLEVGRNLALTLS